MAFLVHAFEVRHILDGSRWENQPTEWSFSPGLTEQLVLPAAAEDPIPAPQFYTSIFEDETYPDYLAESLHPAIFAPGLVELLVLPTADEDPISAPQHYTAIFTDDSFVEPFQEFFFDKWEEVTALNEATAHGYGIHLDLDGSDYDSQDINVFEKWEEAPTAPDLDDFNKFDMEFSPPEIDVSIPPEDQFFEVWQEIPEFTINGSDFLLDLDLVQEQVIDDPFSEEWIDLTEDMVGAPNFYQAWIDEAEAMWVEEQFFFPGINELLIIPETPPLPVSPLDWPDFVQVTAVSDEQDPLPFDLWQEIPPTIPPPIVVGLRADITVTVSETTTITVRISEVTSITASVTLG